MPQHSLLPSLPGRSPEGTGRVSEHLLRGNHDVSLVGHVILLQVRGKGYRGIQRTDARNRSVEQVEHFLTDGSGDFAAVAAAFGLFGNDNDLIGLFKAFADDILVQREQGADINDFGLDAVRRQLLCSVQSGINLTAVGDNCQVFAFESDTALAQRNGIEAGDFALGGIQALVLEEHHRVIIVN